jgi:hypothetical protein
MALNVQIKLDVVKTVSQSLAQELGISDSQLTVDSYARVVKVVGDKTNVVYNVEFLTMGSKQRIKNLEFAFVPKTPGKDFIAQAYDHMKTLSEFSGSTDC